LDDYQRTLDGARPVATNPAFRDRQRQFTRFIEQMSVQSPGTRMLLNSGTLRQLEETIGETSRFTAAASPEERNQEAPRSRQRPRGGRGETRRLWRDTIQPAWEIAVQSGQATNGTSLPLEFERYLLRLEDEEGRNFWRGGSALEDEVFWFSGYGNPQTMDPDRAEANARWSVLRRSKILAWAETADDEAVRSAAKRISQGTASRPPDSSSTGISVESGGQLSKKTAAERTLFYRRVLGAWQFLLAVRERPALARLRELTELERTPLPPRK
jgi:hypothetical protein